MLANHLPPELLSKVLKASLAALFKIPESRVSLKAKSNEGLDAIGRGEAIACHAVATVLAR